MRELVIVGVGELGKLFGAGALRAGLRVTPVTRANRVEDVLKHVAPRTPILLSVGEDALSDVLRALPQEHRECVILLQNELFPSVYRAYGITPTVLVPWVLQKRGQPTTVARPSPIFGAQADLFAELLDALAIAHTRLTTEAELAQALADKYAFILTINTLGVATDRTLGMWLQEDPAQVLEVCDEAARLAEALVEQPIDPATAHRAAREAMIALSHVPARGRSARERLDRALLHAARLGLRIPTLTRIAKAR
jgi:ketopantoate reductase